MTLSVPRRAAVATVALILLAACATTRVPPAAPASSAIDADVFYRPIEPDVPRHTLQRDQDFQLGVVLPDDRTMPEYPARYLASGPARVEICMQAHVGADGVVFGTAAHTDPADCPALDPSLDQAFRAATDAALRQWRFEPSFRCRRDADAARTQRCDDPAAREAVPVTRAYRFVFLRSERGVSVSGGEP